MAAGSRGGPQASANWYTFFPLRRYRSLRPLHLYGFVRPTTGALVRFLCNTVNTALFAAVLARFAAAVGAGPDKRVILVLDGAGWHTTERLTLPAGLRLEFLPPYSPELQPAERLWPLTNESLANRHFASLAELDCALAERCSASVTGPRPSRPTPASTGGRRPLE